jgi:ethanolamine utilization protein EutN
MFLARVTGVVVSTQKAAAMTGHKLLLVEPLRVDPQSRDRLIGTGRSLIAVDPLGAGQGQVILMVQGSSARLMPETDKLPIDAAVIGLVDEVRVGDTIIIPDETQVS